MVARDVDLVLFEVGGRRWAADAFDVVRVDRRAGDDAAAAARATGSSATRRTLVVRDPEGAEALILIDRLLGFERVPASALHALPPFAQRLASPAVLGAWLSPQEMVLLIDLQALVKESPSLLQ